MLSELRDVPDIAIEVVHKHGIEKLDVYSGLGVPEVWFWEDEQLTPYLLREGAYHHSEGSALLPDLDLAELSDVVRSANDQTSSGPSVPRRLRRI